MAIPGKKMNGLLALSPLLVFLAIYLTGSIIAHDFYKVPVAAAFIIASAYAFLITRDVEKTDEKIAIFSRGAGSGNVLMMIWIFVLAGAFAATAKDIGAIDATVNAPCSVEMSKHSIRKGGASRASALSSWSNAWLVRSSA